MARYATTSATFPLLLEAERDAEIAAAKARVAISLVLMAVVQVIIWGHLPGSDMPVAQRNVVLKQVENAHFSSGCCSH